MNLAEATSRVARAMGGRWLPLKWGLAVALVVLGLQALGAFGAIEPLFTDMHFAWRGELPPSGAVVVVGVSPQCTRTLGQWPWPRRYHAQLIEKLAEAGAKVICFDMYFPTPSQDPRNDELMAGAARRAGNVLLAVYKRDSLDLGSTLDAPLLRVEQVAGNIPLLTEVTEQGHINVRHDRDGIIRGAPAGLVCKGTRYYQLGLLAAAAHLGVYRDDIRRSRNGLWVGDRHVPVDSRGDLLINYYHLPDQTPTYWVSRILAGEMDPEVFRGKVVFVGQTDHGLQNADLVATPERSRFGVFVQATVADNIISGRMLHRAGPLPLGLVVLLLSMACAWRLFVRRVLGKVAWSLAFAAAAVLVSHFVFEHFHVLLDLTPCLAVVVVGNLYGALVVGILRADREVERRDLEMETLLETGKFSAEGAAIEIPEWIVASIGRSLGAEGCCLFLCGGNKELKLAASYGFAGQLSASKAAAASEAANAWVAREHRPFFAARWRNTSGPKPTEERIRSMLIVPLATHDQFYGTLGLYNKQRSAISPNDEFTEHDFRLISLLAQQATMTLERSNLADNLQGALLDLEAAQQRLIESERLSAVGRMANMIIHDIKNPMQGIRMFAEMAAEADLPLADRREFSETMCREIDRLVGMCQEILDFARGTTSLSKEGVVLDDFVNETTLALESELEQSGVHLETDLAFGSALRLDANRMRRALLNLCRNATEAMAESGGTLRVATSKRGEHARIEVSDTGRGIPAEIAETLFEPFVTQGKDQGTGLGLAIVKKVIEDHGGSIDFTTRAGQGSTFTIRLPA